MTDKAPDRIWMETGFIQSGKPVWEFGDWAAVKADLAPQMGPHVEYIRADRTALLASPEVQALMDEAREQCAAIAEQYECLNCGAWFLPSNPCGCDRPSWGDKRTPEQIVAAIRERKTP